jgi:hypothetical protein
MKKVLVMAVSLLALAATTAAPAGAGAEPAAASPSCGLSPSLSRFSSLGALQTASGARANGKHKEREPKLRKSGKKDQLDRARGRKGSKDFRATIGVYVHVVTDGADGQVSKHAIEQQLNVLNLAYGGFYGGVNTGFRFKLKGIDRTDNPAWFGADVVEQPEVEAEMKQALKRGKPDELDLYTTSGNGVFAWAYFPDIVTDPEWFLDGVVVDFNTLPGGAYGAEFSLGQTTTHEVGHWLALWHVFDNTGPDCTGVGDEVSDTPQQSEPTFGDCPEGKDSCPALDGADAIHNYMDYSYDSCYDQFTAGQRERMQASYLFWRDRGKYPR